jgi:hypothetical protein
VSSRKHDRAGSTSPKEKPEARASNERPIKQASCRQLKSNPFDSHILSFLTFSSSLRCDQTDVQSIGIVLISFSHSIAIRATIGPI